MVHTSAKVQDISEEVWFENVSVMNLWQLHTQKFYYFPLSGSVYLWCYIAIAMSYGDVTCHYGDIASADTNCDASATAQ